jgi:4-amino-4-deoxy-L-arabinose transferase-like glycosyltransferase
MSGYLIVNGLLLAYLIWDGRRREVSKIWAWGIGTALAGALVLPFYFASRPLMEGEVRSGGYGWNVVRYFALLWTFLFFIIGMASCASVGEVAESAQTDAEKAGAAIAGGIGFVFIGISWFFPLVGSLVVGVFLKKDVKEEGPTGSLAVEEGNSEEGGS